MLELVAIPETLPFAVALVLMLMIGAVEALGLGAAAVDLDSGLDAEPDGADMLGWLGVGKVPLLMLLVVLLAWFGLIPAKAGTQEHRVAERSDKCPPLVSPAGVLGSRPSPG